MPRLRADTLLDDEDEDADDRDLEDEADDRDLEEDEDERDLDDPNDRLPPERRREESSRALAVLSVLSNASISSSTSPA